MKIQEIINLITRDGANWLVVIVIVTSLIQISPLKLDPWTKLANWLGNSLNKSVLGKVADVQKQVQAVDQKLNNHIAESESKSLQDTRSEILRFGSCIVSGNNYTKEEFDFMISKCDKYEEYCKTNKVANGVADATIKEIRRVYAIRLSENNFLKEGTSEV